MSIPKLIGNKEIVERGRIIGPSLNFLFKFIAANITNGAETPIIYLGGSNLFDSFYAPLYKNAGFILGVTDPYSLSNDGNIRRLFNLTPRKPGGIAANIFYSCEGLDIYQLHSMIRNQPYLVTKLVVNNTEIVGASEVNTEVTNSKIALFRTDGVNRVENTASLDEFKDPNGSNERLLNVNIPASFIIDANNGFGISCGNDYGVNSNFKYTEVSISASPFQY